MDDPNNNILKKIYIIYLLIILAGLLVIGKVAYIQFFEGKELREEAKRVSLRYDEVEAYRGNICTTDGSLLATSVPIFEIRLDVASPLIPNRDFTNNIDSLSSHLSRLFQDHYKGYYKNKLTRARSEGDRYFLLKRNVTYAQLKELKKFPIFRRGKYRGGLIAIPKTSREKPHQLLAFRTIGWDKPGEDNDVGLEAAYSKYLKGSSGRRLVQRIGNGSWRPVNPDIEIEPKSGWDIITAIDINLQDVAENALLRQLKLHKADHGCAILMEVNTGYIKAIANLGRNKDGEYHEDYNYAIGEATEPGSTFKLASMLVALEDEKVILEDTIETGDGWTMYHGETMQDVHKIANGRIPVKEVFWHSSNVGVSKIITQHYADNPQEYIDGIRSLHLHEPLDLEISGEGKPLIKDTENEKWSLLTLPWMSVGYEVKVTPLQLATLYNAIANDGKMMRPRIAKEIREAGKTIKHFKPEVIDHSIVSSETLEKAKILLEGVVKEGTAKTLDNAFYKIAGKTGTAQIAVPHKGYNKRDYIASFVGYFPADNPAYTCIVVINAPRSGEYYGSRVAGPVFKDIADKVYAMQLDIHRTDKKFVRTNLPTNESGHSKELRKVFATLDLPMQSNVLQAPWARSYVSNDTIILQNQQYSKAVIPDLRGLKARDAVYLVEKTGAKASIKGHGEVYRQSVKPGSTIRKNMTVTLHLN